MHQLVLVGMGADSPARETDLRMLADQVGARLAYLQLGTPTLHQVLDEIAADRPRAEVRLIAVPSAGAPAPARSWLRRVAADWTRGHPNTLDVRVAESPVTGEEAGLSSPAWEQIPRHGRHLLVCRGPRCTARGGADIAVAVDESLRAHGLDEDQVLVTQTGCLFPCNHGPVMVVHPEDRWLGCVTADQVRALVAGWAGDPRTGVERVVTSV